MDETKGNDPKVKWTRYFTMGMGACAVISTFVTFQGLMQVNGELRFAGPLTVASGIISFLVFTFLVQMLPQARRDQQWKLLAFVAFPGLLVVIATSTLLGILGMAGPEAQRRQMLATADQADVILEESLKRQKQQTRAITLLDTKAGEFAALAETEKKTGQFERRGERGNAYHQLKAISEAFTRSANTLRQDQARRDRAAQTAAESLSALRELAESTKANATSLREASEPYAKHLRTLNVALAELERSALETDVLGPVRTALAQTELTPVKGKNKEEREKAEQGAVAVTQLGTQALEQAQAQLDELQFEAQPRQRLTVAGPLDAVLEHLLSVIHLVSFPVALDLGLPLLAIAALFLMNAKEEDHDPTQAQPRVPPPWDEVGHSVASSRIQRAAGNGRGGQSHPS